MKQLMALAVGVSCLLAGGRVAAREAPQEPPAGIQAHFVNSRVETHPAGMSLARAFAAAVRQQASPAWIGYSVPATPGDHGMCEPDRPRRAYLEGRPARTRPDTTAGPSPDIVVLFRAEGGKVQKLRVVSLDCEIDAGGLPVVWLTGVTGAASVGLLRGFVTSDAPEGVDASGFKEESALMAIALHADPSARSALEAFVAPGQPVPIRKRAAFWLGAERGAVDTLIRLVREDDSLDVRKQAMFWLARSPDPQATAFVQEILRK